LPLLHQGKFKKAVELLQYGIEIDKQETPNSWPLLRKYYHSSLIYLYHLIQPEMAIKYADSAKKVHATFTEPSTFWITIFKGINAIALAKLGKLDKGENILNDDYQFIDSLNIDRLNNFHEKMSELLIIKGEYDSSVTLMEKIYNPVSDFRVALKMGQSYLAAGNTNKAISVFEKAMSRYDENQRYYPERLVLGYYYFAQAYEAAGRTEDAIEQYEIFLDIWKNADEGLKSVEDAKIRLARLKGSS
jgi:tetratricopeptide (TPR) repeat protein